MMAATTAQIARAIGARLTGSADVTVDAATHDSREVTKGALFCCIPGATVDGHDFVPAALDAGAAALLVERSVTDRVPELMVPDARAAMGPAAAVVYGHPSRELDVLGVTGTNGKSSVVQLLADIWNGSDRSAEIYGTLTGARTTPEATDLQRRLRETADRGREMVAIEVSSHALALDRVAGTRFAAAIFTNLGRDHLDFHQTMERYFEAKASLFDPVYTPIAVVNVDDPHGVRLADEVRTRAGIELRTYSLDDAVDLAIDGPVSRFRWRGQAVELHLAGRHNVSNALAAATAADALGIGPEAVAGALTETAPVRGRFELVDGGQPFTVAVDYAHTPDALDAVLRTSRQVTAGRVIVVFGCGGDRDQHKRPEMGLVADRGADLAVVTSDNPRGEDPVAIIDAIVAGMTSNDGTSSAEVIVEPDRRAAITAAITAAGPADLVLIAGKGHETEQIIGSERLPFDDRRIALEILENQA